MKKIFVAGHNGMVGRAIVRSLQKDVDAKNFKIITCNRNQLDLTEQLQVRDFMNETKPDEIYLAAAKVGGIFANNTYPAQFIYSNLTIETNIIHEAWKAGVKKILFLGSSCIYPKAVAQPMSEDALLTGVLEPTNEPYAIAKIAGIKLCESYNREYAKDGIDYRCVMPTNLYGEGDNYHPENSHVIPGLIRRIHEAKINNYSQVAIWGSGKPRREFLYVDDLAEASIFVMNLDKKTYDSQTKEMQIHINIGFGSDVTILELAQTICRVVGFTGEIKLDASKPDGTMQKLMNSTRINNLGWRPKINLREGLEKTYYDFLRSSKV